MDFGDNEILLKACIDGAKATLDACLLLCTQPKPQNASIDPNDLDAGGFLPPINPWSSSYVVNADVTDTLGLVDSIEFFVTESTGVIENTTLVGSDADGGDGWSVDFDPSSLPISDDSSVIVHIEALNSIGELLVGDSAVAAVIVDSPTMSKPGMIAVAVLLAGVPLAIRRLRSGFMKS